MIYFEPSFVPEYGLNHPQVLWNSATRRATVSASSEATGFAAVNALNPFESSFWKPTSTADATLDFSFPEEPINSVGLVGHNLGSVGAVLTAYEPDGVGGWTQIGNPISPVGDDPLVFLLADRDLTGFRLGFSGAPSEAVRVASVMLSKSLEFPVRVYSQQQAPANMSRSTTFRNNETISGNWTGRSIQRSRNRVDVPLQHLKESWILENADPFFADAREYPYFLCPRPASYPKDVQYKWMNEDIVPTRMPVGFGLMEVTL